MLRRSSSAKNPKKFCCMKLVNDLDGYLADQKRIQLQNPDPIFD